jgi:hypothetical protein
MLPRRPTRARIDEFSKAGAGQFTPVSRFLGAPEGHSGVGLIVLIVMKCPSIGSDQSREHPRVRRGGRAWCRWY